MLKINKYAPKKIIKRNRKKYLLDPIREKLIMQTPEEIVRQKFVQYLIKDKGVPKDMIDIEVPMSRLVKDAKGRADIVVYSVDESNFIPILVIECKSPNTPLVDDVFNQVYDYADLIFANTIAVTNGDQLYIEAWNEDLGYYVPLEELPNYKDIVSENNFKYIKNEPFVYKRRRYEEFTTKEVLEFYQGLFLGVTDERLHTFMINLNELFWDDNVKIPYNELYGVKIIEDIGVRYTKFGNVAGYDWTGEYRSVIVQDKKGSNQIVSLAVLEGYIVVAIENDKHRHNSLQLFIQNFVSVNGKYIEVVHNGRLTLGKSGMVKFDEVIDFIQEKEPKLLNKERKIEIGRLDCSRQFDWNQEDVKDFIGRIIKYALLRDDLREFKRKGLKKRKSTLRQKNN
jgi:hypothetical protein